MTEEPIKRRTKSRDDMKNQQRREQEAGMSESFINVGQVAGMIGRTTKGGNGKQVWQKEPLKERTGIRDDRKHLWIREQKADRHKNF
jgi:hypothetical protein